MSDMKAITQYMATLGNELATLRPRVRALENELATIRPLLQKHFSGIIAPELPDEFLVVPPDIQEYLNKGV